MSRMPRIQIEGAIYYLVPAQNHGKPIFRSDEDYIFYLKLLARYKNKHGFQLFAFCLTPNSINLLIEPSSNATISRIMHDLNPGYTKYFNGKYKRAGRLFRERYRMVLIEKAPNLLNMTAYIHLRPKLLHLTSNISNYKHTSFLTYLTEERGKPGTETLSDTQGDKLNMTREVAYVLGCLKDKSYQQLVNEMDPGEIKELNKVLEKETVVGSADFRQAVAAKVKGESQAPETASQPIPVEEPEALPQPAPIEEPEALPRYVPIEKPDILPPPMLTQIPKAASRPVSNAWIFVVAGCLVALSFAFSMFFAHTNILRLKENMTQEIAGKEIESQNRLARELDTVSKDLSNTYEAKLAAYQAVIERLETEKQKAEDELSKARDELSKARLSLRLRSDALRRKKNEPRVN